MIDFKIIVANKIFQFKCGNPRLTYDPRENMEFSHFLYSGTGTPDVMFDIKYGAVPEFAKSEETYFNVDGARMRSVCNGKILFEYPDKKLPGRMTHLAALDGDMRHGVIYVNREMTPSEECQVRRMKGQKIAEKQKRKRSRRKRKFSLGKSVISGIKGNLFHPFFAEYLVKNRIGVLVHSACIQLDGETHLYMGRSGTGKSTISGFMHDNANARVLNDDRGIFTIEDGGLIYYNAPWLGDFFRYCDVKPEEKARIDKIFFISHDDRNRAEELSQTEAASRLFANSFPVFWSKEDLDYVLQLCAKAVGSCQCYYLGFVNDTSVIGFIKNFMKPGVSMRLLAESSEAFRL